MITFKIKLTNENTPFDVDTYLNLMEMDELSHEMEITKEDLLRSLISSGRDGEVLWLVARLLAHYKSIDNDIVKLKLREINNLVIPAIRKQKELLKAYESMLLNAGDLTQEIKDKDRDDFIKSFNCL